MGKCKFNDNWLSIGQFADWLKRVPADDSEAYCTFCKRTLKLGTLGIKALESHTKSSKHQESANAARNSHGIAQFCSVASSTSSINNMGNIRDLLGSTDTMKAEVLWALNTVAKHQSCRSNDGIGELFQAMFPDSTVAKTFQCGRDKTSYILRFGVAEFVKKELISKVTGPFVIMFDESLNHATKRKQLDLHVRYWDDGQVQSRYLGSQFMGHATANDLLKEIKECAGHLDLSKLISISMDGPNVDKILRALHTLLHNVPARREDYEKTTRSTRFPLAWCGHQWLENLPVVIRALDIWSSMLVYTNAVRRKELPNPGTGSFAVIEEAQKDPLTLPKLQFFRSIAQLFDPFLRKYQTEEPVMPYLGKDLAELIKSLMRRFVKREVLQDITTAQLTKLDIGDKNILMPVHCVDIGLGAEEALKDSKSSDLRILEFKRDCMQGLSSMVKKVQEKSPLKYSTVRQMDCLDPTVMSSDPDGCKAKMKGLVQTFLLNRQLAGGVCAGDTILQQFDAALSVECRHEDFISFKPMQKRLDVFLHGFIGKAYPDLWAFCKTLLLLSHGQASVERGFSVNKEIETENMQEETLVAHRLVYDYVAIHGGVTKVPLTPDLMKSVMAARSRYRVHLDEQRKKKETETQGKKRAHAEEQLQDLKVKRDSLHKVTESLGKEADELAEQAEGKAGSKMAHLISKSNALRRAAKDKLSQLKVLGDEIATKSAELKSM
ncbi:uncharacterized protein LOC134858472 isoform X2 [Eleginops maclovinus]|uniref:uncharacterized protein LOC134858472 isoform X2 n=1 Tax=Eleginops maclovinus TaxID=56733 RepID=UPI0030801331